MGTSIDVSTTSNIQPGDRFVVTGVRGATLTVREDTMRGDQSWGWGFFIGTFATVFLLMLIADIATEYPDTTFWQSFWHDMLHMVAGGVCVSAPPLFWPRWVLRRRG